jgi:chromosome segregation ATPase|tara:strand:- start:321 stop:590 length:270 start_codon:yes stop_codon:yes gene_type:complete
MPGSDFDAMTRRFFRHLAEGRNEEIGIREYVQALAETLSSFKPRTLTEQRRLAVAKQQLKEIKRHSKKLQETVTRLEEQISILEENKEG